jgi:hypothetical protein
LSPAEYIGHEHGKPVYMICNFGIPCRWKGLGIMNWDKMIFFKLLYLGKNIWYWIKSAIEAEYRSGLTSNSYVTQFVIEKIMVSRSAQQFANKKF